MATGARVYDDGIGLISSGVYTTLDFYLERYDYGSLHSTVSNQSRLTAPTKGVYQIWAGVSWAANATGQRGMRLLKNGTVIAQVVWDAPASGVIHQEISTLWELNANEYVQVQVMQSSGTNLLVNVVANAAPEFAMHMIEAT